MSFCSVAASMITSLARSLVRSLETFICNSPQQIRFLATFLLVCSISSTTKYRSAGLFYERESATACAISPP